MWKCGLSLLTLQKNPPKWGGNEVGRGMFVFSDSWDEG